MLAALLILGAITLYVTNINSVREINIFAAVLLVQSLPFIAAVALAAIERSPLNDFATWRALEARCCRAVAEAGARDCQGGGAGAGSRARAGAVGRGYALPYSGTTSPEPPNSLGKSFSLGTPSRIGKTVSA